MAQSAAQKKPETKTETKTSPLSFAKIEFTGTPSYTLEEYNKDVSKAPEKLSSACRVAFALLGEETPKEAVAEYVVKTYGDSLDTKIKGYKSGMKLGELQKANPSFYSAMNSGYKKVFGEAKSSSSSSSKEKKSETAKQALAPFNFDQVGAVLEVFGGDISKAQAAVESLSKIGDIASIKSQLDKAKEGIEAVGSLEKLKAIAAILTK